MRGLIHLHTSQADNVASRTKCLLLIPKRATGKAEFTA